MGGALWDDIDKGTPKEEVVISISLAKKAEDGFMNVPEVKPVDTGDVNARANQEGMGREFTAPGDSGIQTAKRLCEVAHMLLFNVHG
ncbi:hypothetical protein EAH_00024910 [Eimeria acervulina]|uniref:Uncharacterized protein n=1 Tax=Eimeria acervulina TaxID=5801 RepID=U6GR68_EIMAC|nr:hypothetical protein EAH_00024910 [Eimeria acervulina]CDI82042.1 hypothetical protein EAH_00024910 [Eimeria acervulina]